MATREEKLAVAMSILDIVGGMLMEMFKVVQERRGNVKAIVAAGGDISEADWAKSDSDFDAAYQAFMDELNQE